MGTELAIVDLAGRIPINLSRGQALLVIVLVCALLVSLLAGSLLEALLTSAMALILRLTRHRPPSKSSFSSALDELDARLNRKDK